VESGLENSEEAHKHMSEFYKYTVGQRGVIIKVFALLLFFMLLLVVWT
jgi:hypothetical protein